MIGSLLADTTSSIRSSNTLGAEFPTNLGVPQGDSLSPILFIIFLEVTLQDICRQLQCSMTDLIVYADDTDFILQNFTTLDSIQADSPKLFNNWDLKMNESKTETTIIWKQKDKEK